MSDVPKSSNKPELVVRRDDLTMTARALASIIATSDRIFDRGSPVRVVAAGPDEFPTVEILTADRVVIEAHDLARPVELDSNSETSAKTLPDRVARYYLALGEWGLPRLKGITCAPLLSSDGAIRAANGYDAQSGLLCSNIPAINVPARPSIDDARATLQSFRTFPFADAPLTEGDPPTIDHSRPPGADESAFLAGLLTAICRASLTLAPGLAIVAPPLSGSGVGKGLLVRAISAIAFGISPRSFTTGSDVAELDKRLASALMEAAPVVFVDNINSTTLRSDLLASVLSEPNVDCRVLGVSRMVRLNSSAFVAVTSNGLCLSEDLTRRFITCELDAKTEDPEGRPFAPGFLDAMSARRLKLQTAALTIWRWGRQNDAALRRGRPLGSYETWCCWVRDPLVGLGLRGPCRPHRPIESQRSRARSRRLNLR
jgi:putative DNA primase/helicase